MKKAVVSYKTRKRIDSVSTRRLFQRGGFNDWFTATEVVRYLRHALFVASAWAGRQCVGIAVLTGDDRIGISVDLLLVDPAFQGQGIGSKLMALVVAQVEKLNPYHVGVEVFERRTELLFPDTLGALDSLTARGWQHILLTNHTPELPVLLAALGLHHRFAAVFNSAETGIEKPNPLAFANVLASLPPAAQVWMVGDNPVADIQGAEAAGIPAILVRKPHPSAKRFAADLLALDALVEVGAV